MNNNRLYVFYGCWIEYTLHPLYEYMKEQGYRCVEITTGTCSDMKKALLDLNAKESVFITSAHLFLDETYEYYRDSPVTLGVLEAIDILKPVKSVYYAHDLATPIAVPDSPWLNSIFDVILLPFSGFAHLACHGNPVYTVGWSKKQKKIGKPTRYQVGHGVSEWGHYRDGPGLDYLYSTFQPIWEQGVTVKTGAMKDIEGARAFWEQHHVKHIDASQSIFELIESCEIMLTNARTSVTLESALSGRFTINMLDGVYSRLAHEGYFQGIPNLQIMSISDAAALLRDYYRGEFIPPIGEDLLKPFDFQKAVALVTE